MAEDEEIRKRKKCCLCNKKERPVEEKDIDIEGNLVGPFYPPKQGGLSLYAHANCVIFSSELQATCFPLSDKLKLQNVLQTSGSEGRFGFIVEDPEELATELTSQLRRLCRRGRCPTAGLCYGCKGLGATLGCCVSSCKNSYHVACARKSGAAVLYVPRCDDPKDDFPPNVVALCEHHIKELVTWAEDADYQGDVLAELQPAPGTIAVDTSQLHYMLMHFLTYFNLNVPVCKLGADEDKGTSAVMFAYGNVQHLPHLPFLPRSEIRPLDAQVQEQWLTVKGKSKRDLMYGAAANLIDEDESPEGASNSRRNSAPATSRRRLRSETNRGSDTPHASTDVKKKRGRPRKLVAEEKGNTSDGDDKNGMEMDGEAEPSTAVKSGKAREQRARERGDSSSDDQQLNDIFKQARRDSEKKDRKSCESGRLKDVGDSGDEEGEGASAEGKKGEGSTSKTAKYRWVSVGEPLGIQTRDSVFRYEFQFRNTRYKSEETFDTIAAASEAMQAKRTQLKEEQESHELEKEASRRQEVGSDEDTGGASKERQGMSSKVESQRWMSVGEPQGIYTKDSLFRYDFQFRTTRYRSEEVFDTVAAALEAMQAKRKQLKEQHESHELEKEASRRQDVRSDEDTGGASAEGKEGQEVSSRPVAPTWMSVKETPGIYTKGGLFRYDFQFRTVKYRSEERFDTADAAREAMQAKRKQLMEESGQDGSDAKKSWAAVGEHANIYTKGGLFRYRFTFSNMRYWSEERFDAVDKAVEALQAKQKQLMQELGLDADGGSKPKLVTKAWASVGESQGIYVKDSVFKYEFQFQNMKHKSEKLFDTLFAAQEAMQAKRQQLREEQERQGLQEESGQDVSDNDGPQSGGDSETPSSSRPQQRIRRSWGVVEGHPNIYSDGQMYKYRCRNLGDKDFRSKETFESADTAAAALKIVREEIKKSMEAASVEPRRKQSQDKKKEKRPRGESAAESEESTAPVKKRLSKSKSDRNAAAAADDDDLIVVSHAGSRDSAAVPKQRELRKKRKADISDDESVFGEDEMESQLGGTGRGGAAAAHSSNNDSMYVMAKKSRSSAPAERGWSSDEFSVGDARENIRDRSRERVDHRSEVRVERRSQPSVDYRSEAQVDYRRPSRDAQVVHSNQARRSRSRDREDYRRETHIGRRSDAHIAPRGRSRDREEFREETRHSRRPDIVAPRERSWERGRERERTYIPSNAPPRARDHQAVGEPRLAGAPSMPINSIPAQQLEARRDPLPKARPFHVYLGCMNEHNEWHTFSRPDPTKPGFNLHWEGVVEPIVTLTSDKKQRFLNFFQKGGMGLVLADQYVIWKSASTIDIPYAPLVLQEAQAASSSSDDLGGFFVGLSATNQNTVDALIEFLEQRETLSPGGASSSQTSVSWCLKGRVRSRDPNRKIEFLLLRNGDAGFQEVAKRFSGARSNLESKFAAVIYFPPTRLVIDMVRDARAAAEAAAALHQPKIPVSSSVEPAHVGGSSGAMSQQRVSMPGSAGAGYGATAEEKRKTSVQYTPASAAEVRSRPSVPYTSLSSYTSGFAEASGSQAEERRPPALSTSLSSGIAALAPSPPKTVDADPRTARQQQNSTSVAAEPLPIEHAYDVGGPSDALSVSPTEQYLRQPSVYVDSCDARQQQSSTLPQPTNISLAAEHSPRQHVYESQARSVAGLASPTEQYSRRPTSVGPSSSAMIAVYADPRESRQQQSSTMRQPPHASAAAEPFPSQHVYEAGAAVGTSPTEQNSRQRTPVGLSPLAMNAVYADPRGSPPPPPPRASSIRVEPEPFHSHHVYERSAVSESPPPKEVRHSEFVLETSPPIIEQQPIERDLHNAVKLEEELDDDDDDSVDKYLGNGIRDSTESEHEEDPFDEGEWGAEDIEGDRGGSDNPPPPPSPDLAMPVAEKPVVLRNVLDYGSDGSSHSIHSVEPEPLDKKASDEKADLILRNIMAAVHMGSPPASQNSQPQQMRRQSSSKWSESEGSLSPVRGDRQSAVARKPVSGVEPVSRKRQQPRNGINEKQAKQGSGGSRPSLDPYRRSSSRGRSPPRSTGRPATGGRPSSPASGGRGKGKEGASSGRGRDKRVKGRGRGGGRESNDRRNSRQESRSRSPPDSRGRSKGGRGGRDMGGRSGGRESEHRRPAPAAATRREDDGRREPERRGSAQQEKKRPAREAPDKSPGGSEICRFFRSNPRNPKSCRYGAQCRNSHQIGR